MDQVSVGILPAGIDSRLYKIECTPREIIELAQDTGQDV
jgi:hypothetical protein